MVNKTSQTPNNFPFCHACLKKSGGNIWFLFLLFWVTSLPGPLSSLLNMHNNYSETALNLCVALRSNGRKRLRAVKSVSLLLSCSGKAKVGSGRETERLWYCKLPGTLASERQREKMKSKTKQNAQKSNTTLPWRKTHEGNFLLNSQENENPANLTRQRKTAGVWRVFWWVTARHDVFLQPDAALRVCVWHSEPPSLPLNIVSFIEQQRHCIITSVPGLCPTVSQVPKEGFPSVWDKSEFCLLFFETRHSLTIGISSYRREALSLFRVEVWVSLRSFWEHSTFLWLLQKFPLSLYMCPWRHALIQWWYFLVR